VPVVFNNIAHGVRGLPARGVLLAGDTDKSRRFAKLSVLVSMHHQCSWLPCVHLSVECAALHPEHHPVHAVAH
jgi:hypothetical protein